MSRKTVMPARSSATPLFGGLLPLQPDVHLRACPIQGRRSLPGPTAVPAQLQHVPLPRVDPQERLVVFWIREIDVFGILAPVQFEDKERCHRIASVTLVLVAGDN